MSSSIGVRELFVTVDYRANMRGRAVPWGASRNWESAISSVRTKVGGATDVHALRESGTYGSTTSRSQR